MDIDNFDGNISRTKTHELAMICIYQYLFYNTPDLSFKKATTEIISDVMEMSYDSCDDFFKAIIFVTIKTRKEYIEEITTHLSSTWKFTRLSLVEQAILLLFTSQIKNRFVEKHVAIDVAVDLSKKFCDDGSYKFINAVLDKISIGEINDK